VLVADESLYPIVDDEYEIFMNSYRRAEIKITVFARKDIINQLMTDSTQVAISVTFIIKIEVSSF
jgi:phosphate transport system substrate-binding protein